MSGDGDCHMLLNPASISPGGGLAGGRRSAAVGATVSAGARKDDIGECGEARKGGLAKRSRSYAPDFVADCALGFPTASHRARGRSRWWRRSGRASRGGLAAKAVARQG